MAPGDLNFYVFLKTDTPNTVEVLYGLAVEKDGQNLAEAYMRGGSGRLERGSIGYNTSYNFTQPGRYVVRVSGCVGDPAACTWTTFPGTTVVFEIR